MLASVRVHPAVQEAIDRGEPVVALESTLIAHGLPRPDNLELAHEAQRLARDEGAVPATVGVIAGVPTVGLGDDELALMADGATIPKLSIRDLPLAMVKGVHGATTVASTAYLAAAAGIRVFATGGLGGVHRDARESWDVSADLSALATTQIAVVCAGVKSILDVPATLECLETLGVPVCGFGTARFPGFYIADSGYALEWRVDTADEAAAVVAATWDLGLARRGIVIANPVPEQQQLDRALHDRVLAEGLTELRRRGITGKAVTPFLLAYLKDATGGASLRVNKDIIRHNVRVAARIAGALSRRAAPRLE